MILLDTNFLARLTSKLHPHGLVARDAVRHCDLRNEQLVIVAQCLFEFWVVATRNPGTAPAGQNGLGMTPHIASLWMQYFQRRFTLLVDRENLTDQWHQLVKTIGIKGLKSHDARIAAAMQTYGIQSILTFNSTDFKHFGLTLVDPYSI